MKPTKEELERLYYKEGLTQKQIGEKYGMVQSSIWRFFKEYEIKADRIWKPGEVDYLEEKFGLISIPSIAKSLKRSEAAVRVKAIRIGLTSALLASGKLTANDIAETLHIDSHVVTRWIESRSLKAEFKVVRSSGRYWQIEIDDFWKWAEKHQNHINFAKLEENAFGSEPDWVKLKRKMDAKERPKNEFQKWTPEEDAQLRMLWNLGLQNKEIAQRLSRSTAGICKRSKKLNLKIKRIALLWTDKEVNMLIGMKLNGALDKDIAWELGREEGQVSWKRKDLIKRGLLNWKYRREGQAV